MCKPRQEPVLTCQRCPRVWPRSLLPPPAVLCPAPEGAASRPEAVPTPGELCPGLPEPRRGALVQVGTGRALRAAPGSHAAPGRCRSSGGGTAHLLPEVSGCFVPMATAARGPAPRIPTASPACGLADSGRAACSCRTPSLGDPLYSSPSWLGRTPGLLPITLCGPETGGPPAHPSRGTQPLGLLGRGPGWGRGGPGRSAAP